MTASTPLYEPKATALSQRDEQNNIPSQAYGAVEPIIAPPQQQQPPAEPYGRQQNLTRSSLPQTPTSILNGSMTDVQIPPSSSSTQPPAQMPAPLRVQPRRPAFPAPLTAESLVSTLMQGRPVPRLDARDPKHGSALMEATVAGGLALGHALIMPNQFRESVKRAGGLEEHVKGYLSYGGQFMGQRV